MRKNDPVIAPTGDKDFDRKAGKMVGRMVGTEPHTKPWHLAHVLPVATLSRRGNCWVVDLRATLGVVRTPFQDFIPTSQIVELMNQRPEYAGYSFVVEE